MIASHGSPESPVVDLGRPRRVHIVAIGGAGMSAIATVLAERGHRVTGSDLTEGPAVATLRRRGIRVHIGHDAAHLGDAEVVVISTAVPADNAEVVAARAAGLPVLARLDLLPALAATQPFLSVSGTHGKTTTTAMLATVLVAAGEEPSYLVGAEVAALGGAAANGSGRWFVIEADESDGSFLAGPRAGALVTNIDADHLEYWGGWDELCSGFEEFLARTDGPRVVCADDPTAVAVGARVGAVGYGTVEGAAYRIDQLDLGPAGSRFELVHPGGRVTVEVAAPGLHNALDAAGALALAGELGVDLRVAAPGLAGFTGAARRFERRGAAGGVEFVDDYAHLPTEVRAALAAGRSGGWGRVVAVFQPHRYSRTEALWGDFATAFDDADLLVLTDIYPAGEAPRPGVTGELLVEAVRSARPDLDLRWCATLDDVVRTLCDELRAGDLCMTIGAGDVTTIADRVITQLGEPTS